MGELHYQWVFFELPIDNVIDKDSDTTKTDKDEPGGWENFTASESS